MRRALPLLLTLLLAPLAGCGAPAGEPPRDEAPPEEPTDRLLAIDGRWGFPLSAARDRLAPHGATLLGAGALGEALLAGGDAPALVQHVGLDAAAAARLGAPAPAPGEAWVLAETARAAGVAVGDEVELRSAAWPTPMVATFFEMERTPTCELRPREKLCFLESEREGEARLRLVAAEGARDLAFLPDLVELGPTGTPAWWNGTFEGPGGETRPFRAFADRPGPLVPAEFEGPMAAGEWTVRFRLEANGTLAPSGAAGIVRVREPGFLWFDDRYQSIPDARAQADATLAAAAPTRVAVRVAGLLDAPLLGAAQVALSLADARALAALPEDHATLVLASATDAQERALEEEWPEDATLQALRLRPLPAEAAPAAARPGALLFAAAAGVDLASLPRVEGAGAPALAAAARPPLAEPATLAGSSLGPGARVLALASAGEPPWAPAEGGRWATMDATLDNLSRGRTLVLASPDLLDAPVAGERVELGEGATARVLVAAGRVDGGPGNALWGAASLVHGLGHPALPRVVVPVEDEARREAIVAAYAAHGLAPDA